jgi:hypothetical protein
MKLTNFLKLVAVILIALGSAAGGPKIRAEWADIRTWHVAPLGSDITGDGTEGSPFATIQHGIDSASAGDTVLVHPGAYTENINFKGKNIVVGSLIVTTGDEEYILETIINGNRAGPGVTFSGFRGNVERVYHHQWVCKGSTPTGILWWWDFLCLCQPHPDTPESDRKRVRRPRRRNVLCTL